MNEDHKIEEAQYFLDKLANPELELREFSFELSAFLTAARSALQYALEEARLKPGGQAWYDRQVGAAPVAKYFKDKRDVSVHVTPVIPSRTFHVKLEDRITFGDSVSVEVRKPDGTIVPDPPQDPAPQQTPRDITRASASSSVTYHFSDWSGPEDVVTLCGSYLRQVRSIILDGRSLGFVS
ncbi:MAG TPA: hypothetical protein VM619_02570 [Luteimonas sp.]|nr:hypothetical protein [Luteimonas sp.]